MAFIVYFFCNRTCAVLMLRYICIPVSIYMRLTQIVYITKLYKIFIFISEWYMCCFGVMLHLYSNVLCMWCDQTKPAICCDLKSGASPPLFDQSAGRSHDWWTNGYLTLITSHNICTWLTLVISCVIFWMVLDIAVGRPIARVVWTNLKTGSCRPNC